MVLRKSETLKKKLASLPEEPGVYLFHDAEGTVLYVGKAKNLRKRVRSYFTGSGRGDGRVFFENIQEETNDLEFIVTDNEKEALILENNLINEHRSRYNIDFRDDKSYLRLRLTVDEDFPRLHSIRKTRRDGARYFGPFPSASALRETLGLVRTRFPLRTCTPAYFGNRSRPCIRFEIGLCSGPCCRRISMKAYRAVVKEATLFLEGKLPKLLKSLRERMRKEAEVLNFEEAGRLRDVADAVEKTVAEQKAVSHDQEDRDVFGLYREGEDLALVVLFVRAGKIVGHTGRTHSGLPSDEEALSTALMRFYEGERTLPPTLLLPVSLPDGDAIGEILTEKRGGPVRILVPKRGPKRALVAMAGKNAFYIMNRSDRSMKKKAVAMEDLRERLDLPKTPHRIECFDASHILGSCAVGAMAVFRDGGPEPRKYRTFRIRTESAGDDFAMMGELIARRFAPGKEAAPDLLVVDGGPGQLNEALKALKEAGQRGVPAIGLAKERETGSGRVLDRLYLPGRDVPVFLPERSPSILLLKAIRDEAHRFAVKYHRKLRRARTLRSGLEEIPGVGPKRRAALLRRFGSLKALGRATPAEIAGVRGLSTALAAIIHEALEAP